MYKTKVNFAQNCEKKKISTDSNLMQKKRKNSKSTDSIQPKKSRHSALIRYPTKNHLNGHLIVIKFQK